MKTTTISHVRVRSVKPTRIGGVGILLVALGALTGCETAQRRASVHPRSTAPPPDPAAMEAAAARTSPIVGRPAPAFTLSDHSDKPFTLADQRGRWIVLYFYPKDDTPGCTCQATEFTSLLKRFHSMNADVVGVSSDSPIIHQFFRTKYDLRITLLSDPHHEVMRKYGAWVTARFGDEEIGRVIRSTFLIDPAGQVAHHWPEVIPEGHAARVKEQLEAIRAQRAANAADAASSG